MATAEQRLIDAGTSVGELMQRAGEGAAEWIWRVTGASRLLIACGPGNNGGDGYVIAETLRRKGCDVRVATFGKPGTDAARAAAAAWQGETVDLAEAAPAPVFVDCLFGTGQSRALGDDLFGQMQRLHKGAQKRIAIDLPSGVETDTGRLFNSIAPYDITLSLGSWKPAHWLQPAGKKMGQRLLVDIGIDAGDSPLRIVAKPALSAPSSDAYKYSRGVVAIVAGDMPGAGWLAAQAAQRSGAGYVKIYAPAGTAYPHGSIVVKHYADADGLADLIAEDRSDVLLIGPGLGRDDDAEVRLQAALASGKRLVLDADALMLLGEDAADALATTEGLAVLTPHGGEFAALGGDTQADKLSATLALAERLNAIILHKGADSIIAAPDGQARIAGAGGTGWLATAGTGDVLAGIIAARRAAETEVLCAVAEAQWLHARAAQFAGAALTPETLIEAIPAAIAECL